MSRRIKILAEMMSIPDQYINREHSMQFYRNFILARESGVEFEKAINKARAAVREYRKMKKVK